MKVTSCILVLKSAKKKKKNWYEKSAAVHFTGKVIQRLFFIDLYT